eukprot:10916227-Alexandrium_andersonii.AAC.1
MSSVLADLCARAPATAPPVTVVAEAFPAEERVATLPTGRHASSGRRHRHGSSPRGRPRKGPQ